MPPPDEPVAETFSADTLEAAMASAVARLGPGLTVVQAQKVRQGMRGLLGKDRYDVIAHAPARAGDAATTSVDAVTASPQVDAAAPARGVVDLEDDPVGRALDELLGRESMVVETAGTTGSVGAGPTPAPPTPLLRKPSRPVEEPPHPAPEVADHDAPAVERAVEAAIEPAVEPVGEPALAQLLDPPAPQLPEPGPRRTPRSARARREPAGWSRASLQRLGLPDAILAGLPSEEPDDDLDWLVALTDAICAVVAPPTLPSAQEPSVLSGWGIKGAIALLEDGARGWPVGTLSDEGRCEPATAVELALAVRRHLLGRDL